MRLCIYIYADYKYKILIYVYISVRACTVYVRVYVRVYMCVFWAFCACVRTYIMNVCVFVFETRVWTFADRSFDL